MSSIFIPVGYALTLTANVVSAASYYRINTPGSDPSEQGQLAASGVIVLGPFNEPRNYGWVSANGDVSYSIALANLLSDDDTAYAPLASPTFSGVVGMASGATIVLDKSTGTESSNAVTINANSGVITTSSLTTAASSSYAITLTNNKIVGAGSIIICSIAGGTNTTTNVSVVGKCTAANTAVITVYNDVLITTALNGTVIINFLVM